MTRDPGFALPTPFVGGQAAIGLALFLIVTGQAAAIARFVGWLS